MKIPSFMKTIRFRITLWYVSFFIILIFALVLVLNVKMVQTIAVLSPSGGQTISQVPLSGDNGVTSTLRNYSIIGVAIIIVVGAIGGYFLSGKMLKPIDKVTSVARRSSYSNLKERLSYNGPDDEIKRLADTFDDMLEPAWMMRWNLKNNLFRMLRMNSERPSRLHLPTLKYWK